MLNFNYSSNLFFFGFSKLTDKQKALISAYAELEDDTPGTIEGVVDTTSGKCLIKISLTHCH